MSRDTDQHEQLGILEIQFKDKLARALKRSAAGELTGVFASPRLQQPVAGLPGSDAQVLDDLGSQIQRLQTKLDMTLGQGIFSQYLSFCEKWSTAGAPKTAEQRYAKELLQVLKL